MPTADLIATEVKDLPEDLAVEVLDFIHFLQSKGRKARLRIDTETARALLANPPLALGGEYLPRDDCHGRA